MALHDDLINASGDAPLGSVLGLWNRAVDAADFYASLLWRPWVGYQLLIALAILAIAHVLKLVLAPRLHAWMRAREGWPMWRIRWLVVLHKRLRGIIFVTLIWIVIFLMREVTWDSRSYHLTIVAKLATAWLIVAFTTRLIANQLLRKIVRYGAWTWVTLSILGLMDAVSNLLDSIGFSIGDIRISLLLILKAVLILGVLWFAARLLSRTARSRITGNADVSPSIQVLAVKAMQLLFYGIAVYVGLKTIGIDLTGLAVLSGAIGVGLGFGLQKVVSNLVSGVILLLDKSIKPGDVISLGDTFGWITSLGARYVSITTRDGKEYLIPNEDLITGQVVNWSHQNDFVRLDIHFGTAYADNPHDVRRIAVEAAMAVPRVLQSKPAVCHITGFGDSSVDYILRFWISDPTGGLTNIRGNVFLALWDAFAENGISIPFPQREVKILPESVLRTEGPEAGSTGLTKT